MLRLRISSRLWNRARDPEKLRSDLERYLNHHTERSWRQPARYRAEDGTWRLGAIRPVMLSLEKDADLKLILRDSAEDGIDFVLVALRRARPSDFCEAITGQNLEREGFSVLTPNQKLVRVGVFIDQEYVKLPEFLRSGIAYAWDRLVAGKTQTRVRVGERTTGFLIEGLGGEEWISELDTALSDIQPQIGRVATDSYEIKKLAELCRKYGKPNATA